MTEIPEPWGPFLSEIDASLESEVSFHCFGGFAITMLFGLPRETSDVDVMATKIKENYDHLFKLAGKGSPLLFPEPLGPANILSRETRGFFEAVI